MFLIDTEDKHFVFLCILEIKPSQKYESTDKLVKTARPRPRPRRCLDCLSRHMCLIIIICVIVVLVGLAGVGVGAYFLATG